LRRLLRDSRVHFLPASGSLVQVSVSLHDGVLDELAMVVGQVAALNHIVDAQVGHLLQSGRLHVQTDGAGAEVASQLQQVVQVQRGHVRLGPAVAAVLDVLLEFQPSAALDTQVIKANECSSLRDAGLTA
jgi:hypothetical protein